MKKKEHKTVLTVEEALAIAVDAWQKGSAPFIIAGALLNDGFSPRQTETIMRWAYLKVQREAANQGQQKEEA